MNAQDNETAVAELRRELERELRDHRRAAKDMAKREQRIVAIADRIDELERAADEPPPW